MKTSSKHLLKLVAALLASATCNFAQTSGFTNNQIAPSLGSAPQGSPSQEFARPGSLNYVEGEVSADGQTLSVSSVGHFALQPGESLQTGNGYAEVLLTPGTFLRLGPNSEVRMTSVGLADTRIALNQGSALVEADQVFAGSHLEATLGSTSVDLLKKGLYGFTANPPNVKTFDGKAAVVGLTKTRDIGKHDQLLLAANDSLKTASFDEKQAKKDPLYVWSEARSREEAAENKLVAQNSNGYAPEGGGWFWDPYANYYGFWPSAGLYSPFGFGFYGGFHPGFYGGNYSGYHRRFVGVGRGAGGVHGFNGSHGNGVAGGFHRGCSSRARMRDSSLGRHVNSR